MLFGIGGVLLGWLISLFWPSPYRATKELYVGLNIYQSTGDIGLAEYTGLNFTNSDDYKNWQMANLNSLVLVDSILDKTIDELQQTDDYWSNINREDLYEMLHVYWRNAGKWRLVAENPDPIRAGQVVSAWEDTVVNEVHFAINQAQTSMMLDLQLRSIIDLQNQATGYIAERAQILQALQGWQAQVAQRPVEQQVSTMEHAQMWHLMAQAGSNPSWQPLLNAFPTVDAPAQEYLTYLDQANAVLMQEIQTMQARVEALESERQELFIQYTASSNNSMGLSANLVVDSIADAQPQMIIVRPTGVLMLVGGAIGLAIWILSWLIKITTQQKTESLSEQ